MAYRGLQSPAPISTVAPYGAARVPTRPYPQYGSPASFNTGYSTICISNLSEGLTERELRFLFKFAAGFERAALSRTNMGQLIGYVRFTTPEQAQAALEYMNGYPLDEDFPEPVSCYFSPTQLTNEMMAPPQARMPFKRPAGAASGPYGKRQRTSEAGETPSANPLSIYIGGIPLNWEQDHLKMLFGAYGTVANMQITAGKNQAIGKIAFLHYTTAEEAAAAIAAMNNYKLDTGNHLHVRYNTSAKSAEAARAPPQ